jgi:hypothetical protein
MSRHPSNSEARSGVPAPGRRHAPSQSGATMLVVLMFIMVGTIAVTAAMHLMGARLQQAEQLSAVTQRRLYWQNSVAMNRQYAYTWAFRDDATRAAVSGSLSNNWGDVTEQAFGHLNAFSTSDRPSTSTVSYPFHNLCVPPTTDKGVYLQRTDSFTSPSLPQQITFYNYLKSYPATLLGDLFVIHKKATGATGTYSFAPNFQVNGRVVIYDNTAVTSSIRATSFIHARPGLTNTVAGSTLPDNYPARPTVNAPYGGSSVGTAVTNGTLNLLNNSNAPSSSLANIIMGTGYWATCTTSSTSSSNYDTDSSSGTSTSDIKMEFDSSPYTYTLPTTSPYSYTPSGSLNVFRIRLNNSTLKHLGVISGVEQLVIEGQTTAAAYTAAASLPPVCIYVDQSTLRDIRFIGENSRPFILSIGPTAGPEIYLEWESTSILGGNNPTRWRMQQICENRPMWFATASNGKGVLITGALRTNYQVNCADGGSNVRFTWQRETEPDKLAPFMPRDAWLETYLVPQ